MENLYTAGLEICNALATGTRRGVSQLRHGESKPGGRLLGSLGLITAGVGVAAAASYSEHHGRLDARLRRFADGASMLLVLAGVLVSQTVISALVQPAAREVSHTLDQQWLKSHPINYA